MLRISFFKREKAFTSKEILFGLAILLFLFSLGSKIWLGNLMTIYKFISLLILFFYFPGRILIRLLKLNLSALDSFVLSFCIGLFLSSEIYMLLGAFRIDWLFYHLFLVTGLVYLIYLLKSIKRWPPFGNNAILNIKFDIVSILLMFMVLLLVGVAVFILYPSAKIYHDGLHFYYSNAYDSIVHMAQIGELAHSFPHQFPFWAGAPLKGYHTGSFLWLAVLQRFGKFDMVTLFLKLRPLFIFPLLVLSIFVTMRYILNDRKIACLATFSIFFIGGLEWVIPLLRRIIPGMSIPAISLCGDLFSTLFNPPINNGLLAFFSGVYFLTVAERTKKKSAILLSAFFFGFLFHYKAFMGAIVVPALIIISFLRYIFNKETTLLKVAGITLIFLLVSISEILTKTAASIFIFSPAYMVTCKLYELGLISFNEMGTWWKSNLGMFILAIIVFLMGNLGIRVIVLPRIYKYLIRWKYISGIHLFLLLCLFLSFFYSNVFALNTVSSIGSGTGNFYLLFIVVINIFFAEEIAEYLKEKRPLKKIVTLSVIIFMSCGAIPLHLVGFLPKNIKYKLVEQGEMEATNYLRDKTRFDSVILHKIPPRPWYFASDDKKFREGEEDRDAFISGLAQRRVVLECAWHIAAGMYTPDFYNALRKRKEDIDAFFSTVDIKQARVILKRYGVDYVWVARDQTLKFDAKAILELVLSNDSVMLYKVKL